MIDVHALPRDTHTNSILDTRSMRSESRLVRFWPVAITGEILGAFKTFPWGATDG